MTYYGSFFIANGGDPEFYDMYWNKKLGKFEFIQITKLQYLERVKRCRYEI